MRQRDMQGEGRDTREMEQGRVLQWVGREVGEVPTLQSDLIIECLLCHVLC